MSRYGCKKLFISLWVNLCICCSLSCVREKNKFLDAWAALHKLFARYFETQTGLMYLSAKDKTTIKQKKTKTLSVLTMQFRHKVLCCYKIWLFMKNNGKYATTVKDVQLERHTQPTTVCVAVGGSCLSIPVAGGVRPPWERERELVACWVLLWAITKTFGAFAYTLTMTPVQQVGWNHPIWLHGLLSPLSFKLSI